MSFRFSNYKTARIVCASTMLASATLVQAQTDPGPRGGAAGAGLTFYTLNAGEKAAFNAARTVFQEVDSVTGTMPGEDGRGLGPTFNGNSCAQCHSQPAIGGSSPGMASKQNPVPNPQVA